MLDEETGLPATQNEADIMARAKARQVLLVVYCSMLYHYTLYTVAHVSPRPYTVACNTAVA
jgi:hypothetical protein